MRNFVLGLLLASVAAFADTPPIIYQFAAPLVKTGGKNVSIPKADGTHNGYLHQSDWTTFNNKLDASRFNYITNADAEIDTSGWTLYNDAGRTVAASVVAQDITWTAVASGNAGNGINIDYIFNASAISCPYTAPCVTYVNSTHVTIGWYNGPTVANNPTPAQLLAAYNACGSCTAIATGSNTGSATTKQYITGSNILANGGDTSPTDGTGGTSSGNLTFTRTTSSPLVGTASFDIGQNANSTLGEGVATDFTIQSADKGNPLQISFYYSGSTNFVLGTSSDIKVFLYDVTNATLLPLTKKYLTGPTVGTIYRYVAQFTAAANSVNYRLILHNSTSNALAWDLKLDSVTASPSIDATTATSVQSLVLPQQPISGAVTDHMVVMWTDGASSWVPATNTSSDASTLYAFATNINGLFADITRRGILDGFSIGPFVGYNQYIDNTAGGISPLPAPFRDQYITMGKGINATQMIVEPHVFFSLVNHAKGSLLTNSGANDGTGDQAIAGGTTGQYLMGNTGQSLGLQWTTPVATAPMTYTAGTHTWAMPTTTVTSLAAIGATPNANGGSIAANVLTLQPASASFGGLVTTGTQTFAGTKTFAAPTLTGDVNLSTGNLLISTIGKGPQVKTGTNAKIGTAVLVAGTVTVSNTSVTANSRIFLTSNTDGGTPGWLRVSAKTNATSFVITSSSNTDTSTVAWVIIESIP